MQLSLPGLTLPTERPLIPVEAAMVLLDRDEDEVLGAVESGTLAWAWDIRREGADRRELRIWRDSLLELLSGTRGTAKMEAGQVLASMLPPRPIRTTELQRFWSCSSTHVTHLLEDGQLTAVAAREAGSGPNSFTRIELSSIRTFLTARRVTG